MPGTLYGGRKAAETNKEKYGKDFYREIGAKGGRASRKGGFAANRVLARLAGAAGGRKSKRGVKMSDEAWEAKKHMYYCRQRVRHFENKLIEESDDRSIQLAEVNYDHWKKRLEDAEAKLKSLEA